MNNFRYGATVLLVAGLAMAGCATVEPGAPRQSTAVTTSAASSAVAVEAINHGEAALARENYESALTQFQRALRAVPDDARARLGLGESYLGLGEHQEALQAFRSVEGDPELGVEALQGKGIALLLTGEVHDARDALLAAVSDDPALWRSWNALGRYYDGQGSWDKAGDAYGKAAASAPRSSVAMIHNNWGMSALGQKRYAEAIDEFTAAIDHDKSMTVAQANLRLALAFQGRYAEAMSGLSNKEVASSLNNMGFVAMLRGDHGRAEAYLLRALESSPSFNETASSNLQLLASMKQVDIPTGNEGNEQDERTER